ncbi:TPA: hypothetical protein ACFOQZ_001266 [Neisseria meningitidis]
MKFLINVIKTEKVEVKRQYETVTRLNRINTGETKEGEARRVMAHEWADKWEQDYLSLLSQIKQAISKGHDDDLVDLFADLRGLQQPKFEALHRVIDELISPTRELIDD